MKIITIDEYLIVNLYTHKRRWIQRLPSRMAAYDVAIHIKGKVKMPDKLPIIDFGEVTIPEMEAMAQAQMG